MEESRQFLLKEIVWAKVNQYPWWPARVISILNQADRKLYKVNFFGDPTYCYLESSFLLNFQSGLARSNCHSAEFKLEKPLQLANAAFTKLNTTLQKPKNDSTDLHKSEQNSQSSQHSLSPDKADQKSLQEKIQKLAIDESCPINDRPSLSSQTCYQEVTVENVIQILSGSSFRSVQLLKGYNNKKQFRLLNQKLKQRLLQKYNLHRIVHPTTHQPKRKFIHKIKRTERRTTIISNSLKKIERILKHKVAPSARKRTAVQLVMKLGNYEQNRKGFRDRFRSVVNMINTGMGELQQKQEQQKTKLSELMD